MKSYSYDEAKVLSQLNQHLPSQTPLKDFIYYNELPTCQRLKFYEAVYRATKNFGYQLHLNIDGYRKLYDKKLISYSALNRAVEERTGHFITADWKQKLWHHSYPDTPKACTGNLHSLWQTCYGVDFELNIQPVLFRILCNYLDPEIDLLDFPKKHQGLLDAIRILEVTSPVGFFQSKRVQKLLLSNTQCTIDNLLHLLVGDETYFESYLWEQQWRHHGWSGIATQSEANPHPISCAKKLTLRDVILLELLLEIDHLDGLFGDNWQPLAAQMNLLSLEKWENPAYSQYEEIWAIWQDAYEWSYYEEVWYNLEHSELTLLDAIEGRSSFWS